MWVPRREGVLVDLLSGLTYARCARRDHPRQKEDAVYVVEQGVLKSVSMGYQQDDLRGMSQNRGFRLSQEAENVHNQDPWRMNDQTPYQ